MSIIRHGIEKAVPGAPRIPYARAVEADGWLYVSGQVGVADGVVVPGGIVPEAKQTLDNVIAILKEAGYGIEDVVRVGVWLDDARDFPAFNRVYLSYFGDNLPARACLQSSMMIDCKVEVDCVAYRRKPA
jgi:reactive intermediate/imine deaminase